MKKACEAEVLLAGATSIVMGMPAGRLVNGFAVRKAKLSYVRMPFTYTSIVGLGAL